MNFKINKDKELPYFQIELSGPFDLQDLERCYVKFINHPEWDIAHNILWDAGKCTFEHLSNDDLFAIGDMTNKYREQRGNGLAAWVVSRDIDFGISRMFEMLNENKVIFNFCVFKTIQKARNYILTTNQNK